VRNKLHASEVALCMDFSNEKINEQDLDHLGVVKGADHKLHVRSKLALIVNEVVSHPAQSFLKTEIKAEID
jgi:hypothetical protein